MTTLHEQYPGRNSTGTIPAAEAVATPTLAATLAAEVAAAEQDAGNGADEDSTLAGILAYALIPSGGSLVSGLMQMIERQLFAASLVARNGHLDASTMEDAHRFIHAAIELDRRERAGRAEKAPR